MYVLLNKEHLAEMPVQIEVTLFILIHSVQFFYIFFP